MSRKVNLSICLSVEALEQIDHQAKEQGLSRSAAIEKSITGINILKQTSTLTGINNQALNGLGQSLDRLEQIINQSQSLQEKQQETAIALKSIIRQGNNTEGHKTDTREMERIAKEVAKEQIAEALKASDY